MKKLIVIFTLLMLWPAAASVAQLAPKNEMGVSFGHLHLNVHDVEANKKFFTAVGGTPLMVGQFQVFKFPGFFIFMTKTDPSGGSVGTLINHVGFAVPNVPEAVAKWKAAGLNVEAGRRPEQAYLTSPDQLRIEISEDKTLTVPITIDHIHYNVSDNVVPEIQNWYVTTFGAKAGKRLRLQVDDIPGVQLRFSTTTMPTVPTKGRALDHIGFEIKNLEAFCKKLEAEGMKFNRPYTKTPTGLAIAFITDPWGTYIELTEGLNAL